MNNDKQEITHQKIRDLLFYEPDTGVFRWVDYRNWRVGPSGVAGSVRKSDGYRVIRMNGRSYQAHRMAWLYMTGELPKWPIDHINGHRDDNRINNLRVATRSINNQNQRVAHINNKSSGLLGVTWNKGRWTAQIDIPGKGKKNLGRFDDPEEAHVAYVSAKRKFHAGCTI